MEGNSIKGIIVVVLIGSLYALCISCSNESADNAEIEYCSMDSINLRNDYSIISISQEALYGIGEIGNPILLSDSAIIVNDLIRNEILEVDPLNSSITPFVLNGEGPGDVQHPQCIHTNDAGIIIVADDDARVFKHFNQNGDYLFSLSYPTNCYSIQRILRASDDYLGLSAYMNRFEDESVIFEAGLVLLFSASDSTIVLHKRSWQIPDTDYYSEWWLSEYYVSPACMIYVCEDVTEYKIEVFDANYEYVYTIDSNRYGRLERTQAELQDELDEFQGFISRNRNAPLDGDFIPWSYNRLIRIAGYDFDGRLWIQTFQSDSMITFDIWNGSDQVGYAYYPWNMIEYPVFTCIEGDRILAYSTEDTSELCMFILVPTAFSQELIPTN